MLTHDGAAIPGFSAAECTAIGGDSTATSMRWAGGEIGDIPDTDRPVRLRFSLEERRPLCLLDRRMTGLNEATLPNSPAHLAVN